MLLSLLLKLCANLFMKLLVRVLRRRQLHKSGYNEWLSMPVPGRSHQIAVHLPDEFQRYPFGTYGFTFPMVRTAAKQFVSHLGHHAQCSLVALRLTLRKRVQVSYFGRGKKHCRCIDLAHETGDLLFVAFCQTPLISLGLGSGARLDELEVDAERYLQSTRQQRFSLVIDIITTELALIRTLRGLTPKFGYLDDVDVDELGMELHLSGNPMLVQCDHRHQCMRLPAHSTTQTADGRGSCRYRNPAIQGRQVGGSRRSGVSVCQKGNTDAGQQHPQPAYQTSGEEDGTGFCKLALPADLSRHLG